MAMTDEQWDELFPNLWEVNQKAKGISRILKEFAAGCGDLPGGQKAKAHIEQTLRNMRYHLYKLQHGEEPPCDLPDNWEDDGE